MSFLVIFRFISGQISTEKKFWDIFIAPKDSSLNFRGSLVSYFRAIMLIFAVMRISEDFGSPLPARPVAVKSGIHWPGRDVRAWIWTYRLWSSGQTRLEDGVKYLTPKIICSEVYFRCRSWIVYEIFVSKASRYQQMYIMSASRWKISRWIISGLLTFGVQPSMNWRNCKTKWW